MHRFGAISLQFFLTAILTFGAPITNCPGQGGTGTQTLSTINSNTPGGCQILAKQLTGFTASGGATQGTNPNNPGLQNLQMTGSTGSFGVGTAAISATFGTTGVNWDSSAFIGNPTSSFDYLLSVDP